MPNNNWPYPNFCNKNTEYRFRAPTLHPFPKAFVLSTWWFVPLSGLYAVNLIAQLISQISSPLSHHPPSSFALYDANKKNHGLLSDQVIASSGGGGGSNSLVRAGSNSIVNPEENNTIVTANMPPPPRRSFMSSISRRRQRRLTRRHQPAYEVVRGATETHKRIIPLPLQFSTSCTAIKSFPQGYAMIELVSRVTKPSAGKDFTSCLSPHNQSVPADELVNLAPEISCEEDRNFLYETTTHTRKIHFGVFRWWIYRRKWWYTKLYFKLAERKTAWI